MPPDRSPSEGPSGSENPSRSENPPRSEYPPPGPGERPVLAGEGTSNRAVEQLIEEVETQAEAQAALSGAGVDGRTALVTGGSTGIGRAIALTLARAGAHIALNYLDESPEAAAEARETVEAIEAMGVRVFHRGMDCSNPSAVRRFVEDAVDELEGLHILVNNAGIARHNPLWETSDEEWQAVIRTNLSGAFYFVRAVAPIFRAQEYGKIVNVSSVHGIRSERGLAGLSASKAGILALTRSAALELGPSNVNVNAVAPGYIRTSRLTRDVSAESIDRAREASALGRLGDPQDVAGAVLFLCSEAARHITGAILPVDGGYLL